MIYLKQMIDDFTTTNVPNNYADWDENKSYIVEETPSNDSTCVYENYVYRAVSENQGKIPTENLGTHWIKYGTANSRAMINLRSQDSTIVEGGDIVVTFKKRLINGIVIGNFSGNSLTVENLDDGGNIVDTPVEYTQSPNEDVFDYYSYIYSEYSVSSENAKFFRLNDIGTQIRVTITSNSATGVAKCGFLVGGEITDMGSTINNVAFNFNSYSTKSIDEFGTLSIKKRGVQELVDFETVVKNTEMRQRKSQLKAIYDEILAFVVDEDEGSIYDNLIAFGTIENSAIIINEFDKQVISWSIMESI